MRLSPHYTLPLLAVLIGFAACQGSENPNTGSQAARAAATAQTTLEEDFDYPGAENYVPSGVTLKKGDGNLLIVDCATQHYTVKAETYMGIGEFCFEVRGPNAYLTLDVSGVFLIWTSNAAISASVVVNGQQSVVDLQDGYTPVGFDSTGNLLDTKLVELRLSP